MLSRSVITKTVMDFLEQGFFNYADGLSNKPTLFCDDGSLQPQSLDDDAYDANGNIVRDEDDNALTVRDVYPNIQPANPNAAVQTVSHARDPTWVSFE